MKKMIVLSCLLLTACNQNITSDEAERNPDHEDVVSGTFTWDFVRKDSKGCLWGVYDRSVSLLRRDDGTPMCPNAPRVDVTNDVRWSCTPTSDENMMLCTREGKDEEDGQAIEATEGNH